MESHSDCHSLSRQSQAVSAGSLERILIMLPVLGAMEARIQLRRLGQRLRREDPVLFEVLHKRLQDPERTVRQLSGRDAKVLWGSLTQEDRRALLPRFSAATVSEYDLRVDEEVEASSDPQACMQRFGRVLRKLVRDGRINGDDLWETALDRSECVSMETGSPERVRLVVMQTVLPEHGCLQLFVFREAFEGEGCFLKLVRDEGPNRQVVEHAVLRFDGLGMASWSSPPLSLAGLYEVLVEDGSGEPLARGWTAVAHSGGEGLGMVAETAGWERLNNGMLRIGLQGQLVNAWGPARFDAELHARLRCACGEVIDELVTSVKGGRIDVELLIEEHHGPWFLQYGLIDHPSVGLLPLNDVPNLTGKRETTVAFELPDQLDDFDHLPVLLKAATADQPIVGVLMTTTPEVPLGPLFHQFLRPLGRIRRPRGGFGWFNRRVRQEGGMVFDMGWDRHLFVHDWVQAAGSHVHHFETHLAAPTPAWHIHFFQRLPNGRFGCRSEELPLQVRQVYADLPSAILPGDKVVGTLHVRVNAPHLVTVDNGREKKSHRVRSSLHLPVHLTDTSALHFSLVPEGGVEAVWQKRWSNPGFASNRLRVHLMQPGESVEIREGWIYPDLRHWAWNVALRLMDYPFRCGEQTSSIIAGLGLLREMIREGFRHPRFPLEKVESLLNMESQRLVNFQAPSGRMFLWPVFGQEPPFEWEEASFGQVDLLIQQNIQPLRGEDIPEIGMILERLQPQLREALESGAPYGNHLENLLLEETRRSSPETRARIAESTREYLRGIDGRMHGIGQDQMKSGHYFAGVFLEFLGLRPEDGAVECLDSVRHCSWQETGWLPRILDAIGMRRLKKRSWTERSYRKSADPVLELLRGLAQDADSSGCWGTAGTVRILRALRALAERRPFAGRYRVEGVGELERPMEPVPLHGARVTLLDGEGVVAETQPVSSLRSGETRRGEVGKAQVKLRIAELKKGEALALGRSYTLEIETFGSVNPQLLLFQSGLFSFAGGMQDSATSSGGIHLALPGLKRRVSLQTIRRGEGRLVGRLQDMYDPQVDVTGELEVVVK